MGLEHVSAGITPPSSTTRSSDFCWAINQRSFVLRPTGPRAGTQQISQGKTLRFLRRIAGSDHEINDRNNGYRHEHAFVKNIERNGLLHEADLLSDSYGGKFHPRAVPELISSLPVVLKGLMRRKITPAKALLHPHKASKELKAIFAKVESRPERYELNLYVSGTDEDNEPASAGAGASA